MQRLTTVALAAAIIGVAAFLYIAPFDQKSPPPINREAALSPLPTSTAEARSTADKEATKNISSPSHVPATRPKHESLAKINWARLSKTTPLSVVFAASKEQSDPDERAAATHLAAKCLSVTLAPPTPESIRAVAGNSETLLAEVKESVARLQSYCSEGQVNSFLEQQQRDKVSSGALYKAMTTTRATERRKPEYLQAAIQVLSNPEKYAPHFDMWLSNNLQSSLLSDKKLSGVQVAYIQDSLFNSLTNATNDADSIRSLIRCAEQYICSNLTKLSESEKQVALRTVATIEQQIRTQRWDLLIR